MAALSLMSGKNSPEIRTEAIACPLYIETEHRRASLPIRSGICPVLYLFGGSHEKAEINCKEYVYCVMGIGLLRFNSRRSYCTLVVCEIAFSVLPFAALFLWQRIINTLPDNGVVSSVWGLAALYVSIAILRLSLETFNAFTDKMASETMDNIRHTMIFEKLASLDIGKYYDPDFQTP